MKTLTFSNDDFLSDNAKLRTMKRILRILGSENTFGVYADDYLEKEKTFFVEQYDNLICQSGVCRKTGTDESGNDLFVYENPISMHHILSGYDIGTIARKIFDAAEQTGKLTILEVSDVF